MGSVETELQTLSPDLFVSAFFVPDARRSDVMALYRFQAELAHVATQVAEPMIAQIRYAWWREQVEALYAGRVVTAPAIAGIQSALSLYGLPRVLFDDLIDAHAMDCDTTPFASLDAMETYARRTYGGLFKLAARSLGCEQRADNAVERAGAAYGLARQLAEHRHWLKHRRLRLPFDLASREGVEEGDLLSGLKDRRALSPAIACVRNRVHQLLSEVNASQFPRDAMSILAVASLAGLLMRSAERDENALSISDWRRVLRLSFANFVLRV